MIWLVEKEIEVNGEMQKVLVPTLYLSHVTDENISEDGSLIIAGNNVNITADNVETEGGSIIAGNELNINADEVALYDTGLSANEMTFDATSSFLMAGRKSKSLLSISSYGTAAVNDDAATARSSASFNSGTDIQITSTGDIIISANQINSGGSIYVTSSAGDITNNNQSITAGTDVVMSAQNIINGNALLGEGETQATITAGSLLSLDATAGSITNMGGKMSAGTYAYLTATEDIINSALVKHTDSSGTESLGHQAASTDIHAGDYQTETLQAQGEITGANVVLVAGNDITMEGGIITSTAETYLEAGNDVNIGAAAVENKTFTSLHRGYQIDHTIDYTGSAVTAGSALTITASGQDVNIEGSTLTAAGNIAITAARDINETSIADYANSYAYTKKKSSTRSTTTTATSTSLTHTASNINSTGGNISLTASDDIAITGSDVTATTGTLDIIAQDDISITSSADYSKTTYSKNSSSAISERNYTEEHIDITQVMADATSGGDMLSRSGGNTTITASNLTSGGTATVVAGRYIAPSDSSETLDSTATLSINAAKDIDYDYIKDEHETFDAIGTLATAYGATSPIGLLFGVEAGRIEKEKNYNRDTYISRDETIVASTITSAGNVSLQSGSNMALTSADVTSTGGDVEMLAGKIKNDAGVSRDVNDAATLTIAAETETDYSTTIHEEGRTSEMASTMGAYYADLYDDLFGEINESLLGDSVSDTISGTIGGKNEEVNSRADSSVLDASSIATTSGDIDLQARSDVTLTASNATTSGGNIAMTSDLGDVGLVAGTNSYSNSYTRKHTGGKVSGELNSNEISVKQGLEITSEKYQNNRLEVANSKLATSGGNVTITSSSSDINVTGSDIDSSGTSDGDVTLAAANNVNIGSEVATSETKSSQKEMYIGVRAGIDHNYGKAIDALKGLKDVDLADLAGTAGSNYELIKILTEGNSLDEYLSGNEEGINSAMRMFEALQTGLGGPSASAGISVNAEISGSTNSQITSTNRASNITGNNISITTTNQDVGIEGSILTASNDLSITSGGDVNISSTIDESTTKSSSYAVEVDIDILSTSGTGATDISASIARSKATSSNHNNSKLIASNGLTIISNQDTTIKGGDLIGSDVTLTVGNNLHLESMQNISNSKNRSLSASLGFGGGGGGSGSLSYNQGYGKRYWVDDQSSIIGTNSVSINTTGNTHIKGGLIANIDANGDDQGNLSVVTNSLTYEDIEDVDKARQIGFNISGGTQEGESEDNLGGAGFNYSMHDYEQLTKATIGNGSITLGGSVITDDSAEISGLNRNIDNAQELTKSLSVDPISGQYTHLSEEAWDRGIMESLGLWARADKTLTGAVKDFADIAGARDLGTNIERFENRIDAGVDATISSTRDNLTGNGGDSNLSSLYSENVRAEDSNTEILRNNSELANSLHGLTNFVSAEGLQQALAEGAKVITQDDGTRVLVYQGSQSGSQNEGLIGSADVNSNLIYFNTEGGIRDSDGKQIDIADSGSVMNVLHHEGYHLVNDNGSEAGALRYGNYAESDWSEKSEDNGYRNLNLLSGSEWNYIMEGAPTFVANNQEVSNQNLGHLDQFDGGNLITYNRITESELDVAYREGRISEEVYNHYKELVRKAIDGTIAAVEYIDMASDIMIPVKGVAKQVIKQGAKQGAKLLRSKSKKEIIALQDSAIKKANAEGASFSEVRFGDEVTDVTRLASSGKSKVLSNIEKSKQARMSSNFDVHIKAEGKVQEDLGIWPADSGFRGHINKDDVLQPGYRFDRYGSDKGIYVAPEGTSFTQRSLPSPVSNSKLNLYEVVKPLPNVKTGKIAPWFGQSGNGVQHKLPDNIKGLIREGYIKEIN